MLRTESIKRFLPEAAWVVGGSGLTALGMMVGVRVLTEVADITTYGMASLALGISTLVVNLIGVPLAQTGMHFYPLAKSENWLHRLGAGLARELLRFRGWLVAFVVAVLLVVAVIDQSLIPLSMAMLALVVCDCWRTVQISMLNAARSQRRYAQWSVLDMWLRPLAAAAAVLIVGQSVVGILIAYVVVSAAGSLFFQSAWWSDTAATKVSSSEPLTLQKSIHDYMLPLMPLAVLSWIMNVGDRYVIGTLLDVGSVGIYAAIYGLSSAPVTIIGGTIELSIRPIHQKAVSLGEHVRAAKYLWLWLTLVTLGSGAMVVMIFLWHAELARLLLGSAFRVESHLMPWIAAGYGLRCIAYVFERACYAYGETRHVLRIQLAATIATLVATPLGVYNFGLRGAAVAVPIYFSVQLIVSVWYGLRVINNARSSIGEESRHQSNVSQR
jgi:O-antigen/teichoic acid export membrane protein